VQEVQQVVGILAGGVEADGELDRTVALHDLFESLPQLPIAGRRLGKGQLGRRRLEVVAQEAGVAPVARRVDADADAYGCRRGGWRELGQAGRLRSGCVVW